MAAKAQAEQWKKSRLQETADKLEKQRIEREVEKPGRDDPGWSM